MKIFLIIIGAYLGLILLGGVWEFVLKPILEWLLESKIFMFLLFLLVISIIITVIVLVLNGIGLLLDAI